MSDIRVERRVGDFSFTVGLQNRRWPDCQPRDERWRVLATVLSSVSVDDLAYLVEGRTGISKEGVTGFFYADATGGAPEEGDVPEGKVRAFYFDDDLLLDRVFFDEAAVEYGLAALDCLRGAGQPVSEETQRRLQSLRVRVREFGDGRTVVLKRRVADLEIAVETARDGWTEVRRADGERWTAGSALGLLWRDSPEEFTAMLESGEGREHKGRYRFTYDGDEVSVYVPETNTPLKRAFFDVLAAEAGLAALEGARLLGRAVPEGLERRLRAVRERI